MGWTCYRKEDMRATQSAKTHVLPKQADAPEKRDTGHDTGQRVAGNHPWVQLLVLQSTLQQ